MHLHAPVVGGLWRAEWEGSVSRVATPHHVKRCEYCMKYVVQPSALLSTVVIKYCGYVVQPSALLSTVVMLSNLQPY